MAFSALYAEEPLSDKNWHTEDEYFALEDRSPDRWEFLPDGPLNPDWLRLGRIRAMSGGTLDHAVISGNLVTALNIALHGAGIRTCRVFGIRLGWYTRRLTSECVRKVVLAWNRFFGMSTSTGPGRPDRAR